MEAVLPQGKGRGSGMEKNSVKLGVVLVVYIQQFAGMKAPVALGKYSFPGNSSHLTSPCEIYTSLGRPWPFCPSICSSAQMKNRDGEQLL